jgi:hypothetical protein
MDRLYNFVKRSKDKIDVSDNDDTKKKETHKSNVKKTASVDEEWERLQSRIRDRDALQVR